MWWLPGLAAAHIPVFVYTGPSEDWCGAYASALQGDIVLLEPGDYTGPCELAGKPPDPAYPTELTQFAARDPAYRPRFHSDGTSPAILTFSGEQAQIAYLEFPDVPAGTSAIAVETSRQLWVLDTTFSGVAGTALSTSGTVSDLRLEQVVVNGAGGTGFSLGCTGCTTTNLVVLDALLGGLATGIRVDAEGSLAEIVSDGGVGLDLAGGALTVEESAIRGEVVIRTPATLQSNIVVGTLTVAAGGSGAKLYGNTLFAPGAVPLVLEDWSAGSVLQNNALSAAIPTDVGASGNIACEIAEDCWRDPAVLDLYPRSAGPLNDAAVPADPGTQFSDWCGFARQTPATVGALESLGAPIAPIGFDLPKTYDTCVGVAETTDTGNPPEEIPETATGGDTGGQDGPSEKGCGCATPATGPTLGLFGAMLAFVWRVRTRSR